MSANYIAEAARKDGTEIGAVGGSVATVQLYKVPNVRFDPRRLIWLASLASEVGVVAVTAKSSPPCTPGLVIWRCRLPDSDNGGLGTAAAVGSISDYASP